MVWNQDEIPGLLCVVRHLLGSEFWITRLYRTGHDANHTSLAYWMNIPVGS